MHVWDDKFGHQTFRYKKYAYIKNFIEEFSEVHFKEYPSINQKIIFKFMDLNDELDDEDESD